MRFSEYVNESHLYEDTDRRKLARDLFAKYQTDLDSDNNDVRVKARQDILNDLIKELNIAPENLALAVKWLGHLRKESRAAGGGTTKAARNTNPVQRKQSEPEKEIAGAKVITGMDKEKPMSSKEHGNYKENEIVKVKQYNGKVLPGKIISFLKDIKGQGPGIMYKDFDGNTKNATMKDVLGRWE